MNVLFEAATHLFDPLHSFWEHRRTQQAVAGLLVAVFLLSLAGIELNRHGLLPAPLAALTPYNHFHSVSLAFSLVLTLEVVGLIFTLPCSVAKSVGKQFEILALIMLRNAFKELVELSEPVALGGHVDVVLRIGVEAAGALAVFVILGVYYRLQRHKEEIRSPVALYRYVATKKLIALAMLGLFAGLGAFNAWQKLHHAPMVDFFPALYTLLIFADILLVLVSQVFLPSFRAVFRNSGFAVSTLLIRLALTAPPMLGAAVGVGAAGFAVCLTLAYNAFYHDYRG
ncbi:MAG: hypothetical protein AB1916_12295 [Thermodesulfobacteriota bacterium]